MANKPEFQSYLECGDIITLVAGVAGLVQHTEVTQGYIFSIRLVLIRVGRKKTNPPKNNQSQSGFFFRLFFKDSN